MFLLIGISTSVCHIPSVVSKSEINSILNNPATSSLTLTIQLIFSIITPKLPSPSDAALIIAEIVPPPSKTLSKLALDPQLTFVERLSKSNAFLYFPVTYTSGPLTVPLLLPLESKTS